MTAPTNSPGLISPDMKQIDRISKYLTLKRGGKKIPETITDSPVVAQEPELKSAPQNLVACTVYHSK